MYYPIKLVVESVLFFFSSDFFSSDYCYSDEMTRALSRQKSGDARVIPLIFRPVDLRDASFAKLLMLPKDGFPITKWRNRDEAFVNVVEGIRAAIEQWNQPFVFLAPREKYEVLFLNLHDRFSPVLAM